MRADRPRGDGQRALLRLAQPRWHDVAAPGIAAPAESAVADELLAQAEHDRRPSVRHRGRGACEARDSLLHHDVACQCPAPPLAHAAAAAAAHRLAQPAARAVRLPRRVGGAERRRVGQLRRAQRSTQDGGVAHALERLGPTPSTCDPRPVGRRAPAGSPGPPRRRRSAHGSPPPRPPAPPCRRARQVAQHGHARAPPPQVEVAEAVQATTTYPAPTASSASMRALTETSRIGSPTELRARPPPPRRTGPR